MGLCEKRSEMAVKYVSVAFRNTSYTHPFRKGKYKMDLIFYLTLTWRGNPSVNRDSHVADTQLET